MIKKLTVSIAGLLLATSGLAAANVVKYNPDHAKQFEDTGKCVKCELSGYVIPNGNFSGSDLNGSNLSDTKASFVNMSASNLQNTNLTRFQFIGGNLSEATFKGAVLFGADLNGTNLYGSDLTSEQLSQAKNICNAILPDGSLGKCN